MIMLEYDNHPLKYCPFCEGDRIPYADQPYPGLHAFSILYKCGTDLTITIDQDDDYVTERSCVADEEDCAEWREYNEPS